MPQMDAHPSSIVRGHWNKGQRKRHRQIRQTMARKITSGPELEKNTPKFGRLEKNKKLTVGAFV